MFSGSVPKPNIKITFGSVYPTNIKNAHISGNVREQTMKIIISGSVCAVNKILIPRMLKIYYVPYKLDPCFIDYFLQWARGNLVFFFIVLCLRRRLQRSRK
jgi:hypothetical protein